MLAKLLTYSLFGIDARPVEAEVDISPAAVPKTILVGLAEAAVKESVHRIERALVNTGYHRPIDRIVINLSPADLPKEAASFDLPIGLGILAASGQLSSDAFDKYSAVGELALDGTVRPVKGSLSMALQARADGRKGLLVPFGNAKEAAVVEGIEIIPVGTLAEAVGFFSGTLAIEPVPFSWEQAVREFGTYSIDYSDVKGQEMAKRAVTVAAAGRHHLLMIGSPGTGKTLLAQRIGTILPQLEPEESLETTRIYSAVGRLTDGQSLLLTRPFRSPHHTISEAGLVGGGSTPTPGEISLAHHGILFLDELPEFNRRTLEVMRQPLEENKVTISRAIGSMTFPANLMLVAAMNPCPCGFRGDPKRNCNCSPMHIERYLAKLSGPLLDRIDIHIEVPAVPFRELSNDKPGTDSETIRTKVTQAREVQKERFRNQPSNLNGTMSPRQIRHYCKLGGEAESLLKAAMEDMGLSARAHDKILRVSRTIADLDQAETIEVQHLTEAINYRTLDRTYWSR
ncbi:YifB family Mg chelatase-like AAA ATPase [Planctomicrobium piriforme]|uniref:Magnesium chelatase family protein n=1 Tax=Planctomicrobium piriforme TaxID=1576369 RepID=A0A1I3IC23_9PLAN|nr:YifB family Mg chelatase-like AAA ATPase [Planctomicrobium piriforme]SFI45397.1 magnesium chelatase family protein [Planctomicrobium piriforme]